MRSSPEEYQHRQPRTRIPLSCSECSRRKIKCDKTVPCKPCTERGEADVCHRRRVAPPRPRARGVSDRSPVHIPQDVYDELASLRRRLERVESEMRIEHGATASESEDAGDAAEVKDNGLVGAMEEAALGIGENRRWQGDSLAVHSAQPSSNQTGHGWFDSIPLTTCLDALPSRQEAQFLVDSYCGYVDWISGCLHEPTLRTQHESFWTLHEQGRLRDDMSIAILFAVFSVSAYFLDEHEARSQGFDPQRFEHLAPTWFNCSLATFYRCDGLTHPSLAACQAILVLTYAFHLSGNTRIHGAITHMIIGFARTMNLHLLGSQKLGSQDQVLKREIGRRIWWQIVQQEWYFLPYHRYSSVAPHQFNTSLPELTDEGKSTTETAGTHSLSFLLACCRSSRLLYDLYGTLSPTEHPSYEAVLAVSRRLDDVIEQLPLELQQTAELQGLGPTDHHPRGLAYVRRFLGMMLAYRSYLIHRTYFVKSLRESCYQPSHSACLRAAETILTLSDKGLPATFYRLWNTTLWLAAAGIVLSLDLIHAARGKRSAPDVAARRRRLRGLVDLLENLADNSGIGTRGAKLISHLSSIEQAISDGTSSGAQFTREDILKFVRPNAPEPALGGAHGQMHQSADGDVSNIAMEDFSSASLVDQCILNDAANTGFGDTAFLPSLWGDLGQPIPGPGGETLETLNPLVERTQYSDVFSFFEGSYMNYE